MILLSLIIFFSLNGYSQQLKSCSIYQFEYINNEVSNKALCKTAKYNRQGQLIEEEFINFKKSENLGISDINYFYFYKKGKLVIRKSVNPQQDSTRVEYYYNSNDSLSQEKHFAYKRLIRKEQGYSVFQKERTWTLVSDVYYKYDSLGRKIEKFAPKIHWNNQNRFTWKYNSLGQLIEKCAYKKDHIDWVQKYTYHKKGYSFTITYFDNEGNPSHLKEKPNGYKPKFTHTYKFDNKNREKEWSLINEKKDYSTKQKTTYNRKGLISKTIHYNSKKRPDIKHQFVYQYY